MSHSLRIRDCLSIPKKLLKRILFCILFDLLEVISSDNLAFIHAPIWLNPSSFDMAILVLRQRFAMQQHILQVHHVQLR